MMAHGKCHQHIREGLECGLSEQPSTLRNPDDDSSTRSCSITQSAKGTSFVAMNDAKFTRRAKEGEGLEGKRANHLSFAPRPVDCERRMQDARSNPVSALGFDVGGLILLCFAPASRAQIRCDLPVLYLVLSVSCTAQSLSPEVLPGCLRCDGGRRTWMRRCRGGRAG
jgi:hypothetical protein